jgi:hypothetical protein
MAEGPNWGQMGVNYGLFAPVQRQQQNAFSDMSAQQAQREQAAEQRRQFDASHGLRQQESARQAQQFQQQFGLQQQQHQRQGDQFKQEFGLRQGADSRQAETHKLETRIKEEALDDKGYEKLFHVNDVVQSAQTPGDRAAVIDLGRSLGIKNIDRYKSDNGYRILQEMMRRKMEAQDAARSNAQAGIRKSDAEASKDSAQSRLYDAQAGAADQMWTPHPTDSAVMINKKTGEYKRIPDIAGPQGKVTPGYRANPDGTWSAIQGGPADVKMSEKRQQDFASMQSIFQSMDNLARDANEVANHPGLDGNFGVSGMIYNIPGGKSADAAAKMLSLKAKSAFATLQDMRNSSKTGGALGAVSDKEMSLLESAISAMGTMQSAKQAREEYAKIVRYTQEAKARIAAAYNDHWNNDRAGAKAVADPNAPRVAPGAPAQGRDINQPRRVNSEEEMRSLPSGTMFIAPNGSLKQVP